ncbi:hypothetical protein [Shewanella benthica]|uniref:hypothetical protein n=1 Tax=Shewanella benthica TaxID=43661 RepID=UPI0005917FD9|nr:hypothetical protein [Shewanella benthica]
MEFDSKLELDILQLQTKQIRKTRYSRSRLDKYREQLLELRQKGASTSQLQRWLHTKKMNTAWSTVSRWLQKNG